jgi:hypothetical protein
MLNRVGHGLFREDSVEEKSDESKREEDNVELSSSPLMLLFQRIIRFRIKQVERLYFHP